MFRYLLPGSFPPQSAKSVSQSMILRVQTPGSYSYKLKGMDTDVFLLADEPLHEVAVVPQSGKRKEQFLVGSAVDVIEREPVETFVHGNVHAMVCGQPFAVVVVQVVTPITYVFQLPA